jgi:Raf kinase inhibitor-like YbhB/YbcL family protein
MKEKSMRRCAAVLAALLPLTAYAADKFTLTSAEVKPNLKIAEAQVYNGFGCTGGNVSPSLSWSSPPAGTKSLAVTVYDPDAPTGSGWWHWIVFNLPASTTSLPKGAGNPGGKLPAGAVQSVTDFGAPGYGGPCPPKGDRPHRYIFTVHAIKVDRLDLNERTMPAMVGFSITANRLDKASFTSTYSRK